MTTIKMKFSLIFCCVFSATLGQINPSPDCCVAVKNSNKILELSTQLLESKVKALEQKHAALEAKDVALEARNKALEKMMQFVNGKKLRICVIVKRIISCRLIYFFK